MRIHSDQLAMIVIAVFLVLTAFGNATVMMAASAVGIVICAVGLFLFNREKLSSAALSATVGFAVAAFVAVAIVIGRGN